LLLQFVICIALLVVGVAVYTKVTPFHEWELLRKGNVAAATILTGAVIALAIPLAALLATTRTVLDIVVWGIVAILLQLVTVVVACHVMRRMRLSIDDGSLAAALPITAAQLAIALLNAAAMVPV
jgi:putative membrane protein